MDERIRLIKELEEKRRVDLGAMDETLEKLGKNLLSVYTKPEKPKKTRKTKEASAGEKEPAPVKQDEPDSIAGEYRRICEEMAETKKQIEAAREEASGYDELIEDIEKKESEQAGHNKEITPLYAQIGKLALADPVFESFSAPYKNEMEEILDAIDAREAKLEELDQKTGNIFSVIGKNAQSLVVKTMLMKNQADLHKIYRSAGEKFIAVEEDFSEGEEELTEAAEEAGKHKAALDELGSRLASLKEERKKTADFFRREGSPDRRIKAFEKSLNVAGAETVKLCRRFGGLAIEKKNDSYFKSLLNEENKKIIAKAAALKKSADESEIKIGKLKAAVAIDGEKAGIEKLRKSIGSEERKIKSAQDAIGELEKEIQAAENRISELEKKL